MSGGYQTLSTTRNDGDDDDDDEDARAASNSPVRGAADGKVEFTALHGQRSGRCTTHTHIVVHAAKTQTDALVENPEFLNSGMLVGEDPTLITCSRTPPPHRYKQGGVNTHEHSRILDFRNARYMLHTRTQTGNMYAQPTTTRQVYTIGNPEFLNS